MLCELCGPYSGREVPRALRTKRPNVCIRCDTNWLRRFWYKTHVLQYAPYMLFFLVAAGIGEWGSDNPVRFIDVLLLMGIGMVLDKIRLYAGHWRVKEYEQHQGS